MSESERKRMMIMATLAELARDRPACDSGGNSVGLRSGGVRGTASSGSACVDDILRVEVRHYAVDIGD